MKVTRRKFLQGAGALAAGVVLPKPTGKVHGLEADELILDEASRQEAAEVAEKVVRVYDSFDYQYLAWEADMLGTSVRRWNRAYAYPSSEEQARAWVLQQEEMGERVMEWLKEINAEWRDDINKCPIEGHR